MCKHFKDTLSRKDVKVHFVGAWQVFHLSWLSFSELTVPNRDTVSSIGIIREPSLPETVTGMKHVCSFRHALALDECRVKFLPEYANGGHGPPVKDNGTMEGDIKEVWFAGSHSDM